MNTPNYPYLSGYLQSILRGLPEDDRFFKLDYDGRTEYIQKLLNEAHNAAAKFAAEQAS